jgi:3'-5' exonuclease
VYVDTTEGLVRVAEALEACKDFAVDLEHSDRCAAHDSSRHACALKARRRANARCCCFHVCAFPSKAPWQKAEVAARHAVTSRQDPGRAQAIAPGEQGELYVAWSTADLLFNQACHITTPQGLPSLPCPAAVPGIVSRLGILICRSFQGFTCLMQLSTRSQDFIVDTLRLRSEIRPILCRPFANPSILKVLHGSDSDVMWLQKDFGLFVVNMFDTGQAARLLGMPCGLAFLLHDIAGVRVRVCPAFASGMLFACFDKTSACPQQYAARPSTLVPLHVGL